MPHDRDQHDHRRQVNFATEKAQRGRRSARAATIECTAEADAPVVLGPEPAGPTTWFAGKAGGMQHAAAEPTSLASRCFAKLAIKGEQPLVESGIRQQVSVQGIPPSRAHGADRNGQARTQ